MQTKGTNTNPLSGAVDSKWDVGNNDALSAPVACPSVFWVAEAVASTVVFTVERAVLSALLIVGSGIALTTLSYHDMIDADTDSDIPTLAQSHRTDTA